MMVLYCKVAILQPYLYFVICSVFSSSQQAQKTEPPSEGGDSESGTATAQDIPAGGEERPGTSTAGATGEDSAGTESGVYLA